MIVAVFFYLLLIVASAGGVLVGLESITSGFERYRQAVTITDTPQSSLDAVAIGPTAVSGTVVAAPSPLSLPIDGRPCVAYDLAVSDAGSGSSRRPLEERRAASFSLEADGERLAIAPAAVEAADLDLSNDRNLERSVASYEQPSEAVAAFERDRELPDQGMRYDRTYELEWIEPGDHLYAYGRVEVEPGTGSSKAAILTEGKHALFLSDKSPDRLVRERRFALGKSVVWGLSLSTVSLVAFLWLSGIAQLFLGA